MYVKEPFIPGIFDVIYNYDYALFMAENYDKIDRGEEVEFMQSSKSIEGLIDFFRERLQINVGKYDIGQAVLEHMGNDSEMAMDTLQELYIEYRGEEYCRYIPGGKLAKKNS